MPVSGLVATLSPDERQQAEVIDALRQRPELELGQLIDARLPLVLDTPDTDSNAELWQWLNELPGILHLDLVSVNFEDLNQSH